MVLGRWSRVLAAVLVAGVLTPATVSACTRDRAKHATVDSQGGLVGPGGTLGQVEVPADAVAEDTDVAFEDGEPEVAGTLAYADKLGKAVSITPEKPLPGAKVRLPLDPDHDLPEGTTTANAFIAVFNEGLNAWIPLETTYDAAAKQLVATAPHFSWFSRNVVDPITNGFSQTVSGIEAGVKAAFDGARDGVSKVFLGEQKKIDCTGRNEDFAVTADVSELTGCLVGSELRVQNSLRIPFRFAQAPTLKPVYPQDDPQFIDMLATAMAGSLGLGYLPARGRMAFTVDQSVVTSRSATQVKVAADLSAIAMSGVWTMIGFIPGKARSIDDIMSSPAVRLRTRELVGQGADLPTYFREIRKTVEKEQRKDGAKNAGLLFLQAVECVESFTKEPEEMSVEAAASAAIVIAKKCLSSAITAYDTVNPANPVNELAGVVANFPDGVQFLISLFDDAWFGARQPSATATITLQPGPAKPENPDNATANGLVGDNYAFLTNVSPAGRSITFNAIEWFTGAAATKACKQDKRSIGDGALCHDYYYRDRNDLLRIMEVEKTAAISVLDGNGVSRSGTLDEVQAAGPDAPFRLTIAGGRITAVTQIFVP